MSIPQRASEGPLMALLGRVRRLCAAAIGALRRHARRHAEVRELARLNDHLLRDIGLTRAQILAVAYGPVRPAGKAPADFTPAPAPDPGNLVRLKPRASALRAEGAAAAPPTRRAARG